MLMPAMLLPGIAFALLGQSQFLAISGRVGGGGTVCSPNPHNFQHKACQNPTGNGNQTRVEHKAHLAAILHFFSQILTLVCGILARARSRRESERCRRRVRRWATGSRG